METDASTKRILIETNVIDGNVAETFTFSQAETLHLDFVAYTANQKRIKMPEGGSCKMEAWIDGTPATLYVQKTGTVNTTTRKATVTLSRAESNMPVGDYLFTVKVFDSDDLLTGIIARGTMTALYAPDSDNVDYVGTAPAVTGVWGNITGTLSDQTDLQSAINAKQDILAEGAFVDGDKTKLDGIEDGATAGGGSWGEISGTLSDQTDLQTALDAKADDNAVVKLTGETDQTVEGIIRTSGGSAMGSTVRAATAITLGSVGTDIAKIRIGTSNETVFESLIEGADLILRARAGGETTGDIRVGDLGESVYIGILKALATTGLVVQDSAGTEKLKVGADTGADVQVTGTLSTTDTLTAETAIGKAVSVNAQTGTSYTLVLGDAGLIVTMTNASANTLTIPTNASVAYATGTVINVIMGGAGTTSITGDTGVTVNGISAGSGDISAQYQGVALIKTGTDTWIASGAIGTVA
jgi:hypothetical protein